MGSSSSQARSRDQPGHDSILQQPQDFEAIGCQAGTQYLSDTSADSIYTADGTVDVKGYQAIKSRNGGYASAICILGCQLGQTAANYGISYDLVLYMTQILHQDSASAASQVNIWTGVTNFACLLGAFIADGYLGDYITSGVLSTVSFLGTLLITLSAILPSLKPPPCVNATLRCPNASSLQAWFFNVALYTIAFGNGSQPSLVAFGADQFDENDRDECRKKRSYFNWYYLSLCLGSLIAGLVVVNLEAKIGFGVGFGLSAFIVGLAVVFFYSGTLRYRYRKRGQNPFGEIAKVLIAVIRKWHVKVPKDPRLLYHANGVDSMDQYNWSNSYAGKFRFLDKAATVTDSDCSASGHVDPRRLCTAEQVQNLKAILTLMPIWASVILYGTMFTQMTSVFVLQGSFMNTKVGSFDIPPAALNVVDVFTVIIVTCMYEWLITPFVARSNGKNLGFTLLQRIGIGQLLIIFAMASAAFLEWERLRLANRNKNAVGVELNILWQIPQYALVGASEVFAYIGQIEFFYDQAPQAVQTVGTALSFLAMALGGFLAGFLVKSLQNITSSDGRDGWIPRNINEGHLDYYFLILTAISIGNLIYFLFVASSYRYRTILNEATAEDDDLGCSS